MSMARSAVGMCVGALLVSCGGSSPPPRPTPVAALPPESAALAPLSPVAAPPELFAIARVTNPGRTADLGIAWSALPVDWRSMLEKELPGVSAAATLDAPVDFAAMLDPSPGEEPHVFWAVSYGAPSVDAAANFLRKQGGTVTPAADGAFRVRAEANMNCLVARALGSAPARVVCSDEGDAVDALAPYLTRGLPTTSLGPADIHAHVTADALRRKYGSQLALVRTVGVPFALRELEVDHPKFDRALRDVLYGLADEVTAFATDFDRLDLDVGAEPGKDVLSLKMTLAMSGTRSFWSQFIAATAPQAGVPPEAFFKLPADATSGSYNTYSDPERARGIAAALRALLDGWLDFEGLGDAKRRPVAEAFEQSLTMGAKVSYVTLPVPPLPPTDSVARDELRAAIGAHLMQTDKNGDAILKLASSVVKALGDRSFREHLAKAKGVAEKLPTAKERAPAGVKGLPPGTRVFEFDVPGSAFAEDGLLDELGLSADPAEGGKAKSVKPKPTAKPAPALPVFLVIAPDGPSTWFAFGTDEKALGSRIVDARAGSGPTLATRDGLAPLRTDRVLSGGFSTLASVLGRLGASHSSHLAELAGPSALGRLPHRGETPILVRGTSDAQGPKLAFSAEVPKAVVEDVVALAASNAKH